MSEREIFRSMTEGRVVIGRPLVHQEGSSRLLQQRRQAFELELRMYTGDDPLDVWDRYLKWIFQTYPQGGKESGLKDLLERAVQQLSSDNRYYNDPRYVHLWIKLAQNSLDPLEMFRYMQAQSIGFTQAAFYVAWAEESQKQGHFQKADAIFQEGLKCGAQPLEKLQHYQKSFHASVSSRVVSGPVDRAEEDQEPEPARTSMVDLRPRGRKKFSFNRAEASFEATELKPEPWMAPDSSRTKENELMPEKEANVKVAQRSWCPGSSVPVPPIRPHAQPALETVAQCPMGPAVNMVLTARPPPASDGPGPEPSPELLEERPVKEQSMYLKEQLLRGPMELSFEELRAENYFARKQREIEETIQKQNQTKDWLKQQIEEKTRLLEMQQLQARPMHERDRLHTQQVTGSGSVTGSCSGSSVPFSHQSATPFQIFDESQSGSTHTSGSAVPHRHDMIPDDVFLRPGERGLCFKTSHPLPGGNIPHCKQTLSKNVPGYGEDRVDVQQSNMLCVSLEEPLDSAKPAERSSPYSCTSGERVPSPETDACAEDPVGTTLMDGVTDQRSKLSPIQEASQEVWVSVASSSSSSHGTSTGGQPDPHLSRPGQSLPDPGPEALEETSPSFTSVLEDPCSVGRRQRLLEQVDLSSFPDFCSDAGPLPLVEEDDVLVLGNMTFALNSKTDFRNFSIFEGWSGGVVVVKVEPCAVPWDFYIGTRLRERLARNPQGPAHDAGRCFLFRDGCVTIQKACQLRTLREVTAGPFDQIVASVAIQTVELVRRMHSCHLIHGALSPDTLLVNRPYDDQLDEVDSVVAVDFSCSVDLEVQLEVTGAQYLPAAQDFIRMGLLSPMASPYQVDLLGVAETVHALLRKGSMQPIKDGSEWTLEEYEEAESSDPSDVFWSKFFRTLLNPGDRCSVTVLTGLLEDMKKSKFAC